MLSSKILQLYFTTLVWGPHLRIHVQQTYVSQTALCHKQNDIELPPGTDSAVDGNCPPRSCRRAFEGWHICESLRHLLTVSSIPAGPRGDGKQRRLALPAGDREDQEPLLPQPDAGHEHREEAGPEQQD